MTEQHRAKPEVWAAVEKWCKNDMDTLNCTLELRDRVETLEAGLTTVSLELRDRVEALEAAQRPESQTPPTGTRLLSYKVENSALPVEEWGKGHTIVDSVEPAESNDPAKPNSSLVERVAGSLTTGLHSDARAAILEVAVWLYSGTDVIHSPHCARCLIDELKKSL